MRATPRHAIGLHHLAGVRHHVFPLWRRQHATGAAERAGCGVLGGPAPHQPHHLRHQPAPDQVQDHPPLQPQTRDPKTKFMTNKITSKTSTFCQKLRLTKKHINKKQSYMNMNN